jgi:glycosyltransferase involved in cell wall biosynthesis
MRKNILIFCHGYATPFLDINNQYTQLFDKNQYTVTVAYLVGEPNETIRQCHIAEEVIFINSPKNSTRGLKIYAIKQMLKLQREKQFQIVICHRYKPTYIMLLVSRIYNIPALFSVMHEFKTMHSITRKLAVLALAKNNFILAGVSNAVRDDLRRDAWGIPKERILTFYNAIDTHTAEAQLLDRRTARQQLNLPDTGFIFGTIGRLAKAKDQQTLIRAFANIKPRCPEAKLVIMGTGELETELKKQIAQLRLDNDVVLTGFVHGGFKYIKAFDVFVLPSIKEAFGLVLLEAMIAKTPIIATKINGIPEVIADTGILIPPSNPIVLATEMLKLYQAPREKLLALSEQGYQRVINTFSFDCFKTFFWQLPIIKQAFT